MERENIDKNYKWDLETIYKDKKELDKDLDKCSKITKKIEKYEGKVLKSSKNLYEVLDLENKLNETLSKISVYIGLNYALDTTSSYYTKESSKFEDFCSNIAARLSFVDTELSKLTTDMLNNYLKENKDLLPYKFNLEHVIKESSHILSLESEKLLANLSPVLYSSSSIFDKIDNADVYYEDVIDSSGKKHKLTGGTYKNYCTSLDRTLRKNAVINMHKYYEKRSNAIGECLIQTVKTNAILAKLRGYSSSLESSLSSDDITPEFYKKVIIDAKSHIKTLHRLMDSYKKALKVDEMHIYDINAKVARIKKF